MRKLVIAVMGIVGLALLPQTTEAAAITGTLDIAGGVIITNTGMIDWTPAGGTTGTAMVLSTSTFMDGATPVTSGTATEKDLNQVTQPTTGFAPLDQFETISAIPTVNFVLRDIFGCSEIGGGTTCNAGATSPFAFSQTTVGTTVTLVMTGTVFDSLTPALVSDWTGLFTAQFPGTTIATLLAQLNAPNGFIDTSFSASKFTVQQSIPTVPEPASLLLLGTGVAIVTRQLRKRARATA